MARKSFVLTVAGIVIFFLCSVSFAVVPDKINYQGKLTTATGGGCINDTVSMTFTIYSDDQGTVVDWTEDQDSVIVKEGIFNVLLGSVISIPASVFDGSTKYLGVQVESDPEMRPLKPIVSVAYAYRSGTTDGGGDDGYWTFHITDTADTTLMTGGAWGIARYGNVLYGNAGSTHVNLGVACTTGLGGNDHKYCTVGGGMGNKARRHATTVGGGRENSAEGGSYTTVGGGYLNTASENSATVGGGGGNTASGASATVPGGYADTAAGDYSLAAGRQVRITLEGNYTFAFGRNFTTSTPNAVIFYNSLDEIKVGIGVTNPGNILTVQQGSATDPIADAWDIYSSRRWKTNIQPISEALEKVKRLRGVYFDWKENGEHDIGMIAEEVGEVIPEVVAYEENGIDAQSLDYARLVALLVQAVKEQQNEIEALREQINGLKSRNR